MSETSNEHTLIEELSSRFCERLAERGEISACLDALLSATGARATGLWRLDGEALRLVGFRGVPDMPEEVKGGFASATESVSLSQTGLGIVKAAIDDGPTVARLDPEETGLGDSASWLARFEAQSSLAVPVKDSGRVVGVLAISSAEELSPEAVAGRRLLGVSERIGPALEGM